MCRRYSPPRAPRFLRATSNGRLGNEHTAASLNTSTTERKDGDGEEREKKQKGRTTYKNLTHATSSAVLSVPSSFSISSTPLPDATASARIELRIQIIYPPQKRTQTQLNKQSQVLPIPEMHFNPELMA